MKIETRRKISARFLLAVMLSMLIIVSLHHHTHQASVEETCADCLHHVSHAGHLTMQTVDLHECLLCQLYNLPYLEATPLHLVLYNSIILAVYAYHCDKCRNRVPGIHSPRAPPCSYCIF